MKIKYLVILFLLFFISGCAFTQSHEGTVYRRTKDVRFSGKISVQKGMPMLLVTWKYAKQKTALEVKGGVEELQDCFRSELVYDGIIKGDICFLMKNYICGTYRPVSVEKIAIEPVFPAGLIFHSMHLKILKADPDGLIFESTP